MRTLNKAETIAMLVALKDGDKPLNPGDVFHHPEHGPMVVSKDYGWTDMLQFGKKITPHRVLVVSAFRDGKKKAEKVRFLLPDKKAVA